MGEEVFLDERDRPQIGDQPHWDDCVDHLSYQMIGFCHLQYINHHKVIYFTRELLVRPMGSISQIESVGHIR